MRIVVTGGLGYIGRHLVEAMTRRARQIGDRDHITIVDDQSGGTQAAFWQFWRDRFGPWTTRPGTDDPVRIRAADVSVWAAENAGHPFDAIIHLAAMSSVPASCADPRECFRRNTESTAALVHRFPNTKIILASTAAVYGTGRSLSETSPLKPGSPYAQSKIHAENLLPASACALRLFNVFGRETDLSRPALVPSVLRALRDGTPLTVYGDGLRVRDFVHVDDVVSAIMRAISHDLRGIFNVGSGWAMTVNAMVDAVAQCEGVHLHRVRADPREGDPFESTADILKINQAGVRIEPPIPALVRDLQHLSDGDQAA